MYYKIKYICNSTLNFSLNNVLCFVSLSREPSCTCKLVLILQCSCRMQWVRVMKGFLIKIEMNEIVVSQVISLQEEQNTNTCFIFLWEFSILLSSQSPYLHFVEFCKLFSIQLWILQSQYSVYSECVLLIAPQSVFCVHNMEGINWFYVLMTFKVKYLKDISVDNITICIHNSMYPNNKKLRWKIHTAIVSVLLDQ